MAELLPHSVVHPLNAEADDPKILRVRIDPDLAQIGPIPEKHGLLGHYILLHQGIGHSVRLEFALEPGGQAFLRQLAIGMRPAAPEHHEFLPFAVHRLGKLPIGNAVLLVGNNFHIRQARYIHSHDNHPPQSLGSFTLSSLLRPGRQDFLPCGAQLRKISCFMSVTIVLIICYNG